VELRCPQRVDAIDEFFRVILEYVYVAPTKVADVKAKLAAAKNPK
jgi:hypothetical protein